MHEEENSGLLKLHERVFLHAYLRKVVGLELAPIQTHLKDTLSAKVLSAKYITSVYDTLDSEKCGNVETPSGKSADPTILIQTLEAYWFQGSKLSNFR